MIYPLGYDYLLKIHTKKSYHREDGQRWRSDMLSKLAGPNGNAVKVKAILDAQKEVGMVGPTGHVVNSSRYFGHNKAMIHMLARSVGIDQPETRHFSFVAGTMFWAKPAALRYLNALPVSAGDFEPEPLRFDGTLAHAVERFIGLASAYSGFSILEIDEYGNVRTPEPNATLIQQ
jgi:lipopolysaccharide biosynthesis protein